MVKTKRWELIRRLFILISLGGIVVCVVLLLNFTAANPTGRRYSSDVPPSTGADIQKSSQAGKKAEVILSHDLGLPLNTKIRRQKCVCDHPAEDVPPECSSCLIHFPLPGERQFYIPDFVGKNFIAESKHTGDLNSSTYNQISAFARTASEKGWEFWLFVDVNAEVEKRYLDLFEDTEGGIVYYFTVPGYEDPVDRDAKAGLLVLSPVFVGPACLEIYSRRTKRRSRPPQTAIEAAESFASSLRERAKAAIDKSDAYGEE